MTNGVHLRARAGLHLAFPVPLPEGVTEADIAATYKDGVLEIRVPEPKAVRPRR